MWNSFPGIQAVIFLVSAVLAVGYALPCSCIGFPPFLEIAEDPDYLILSGTVVSHSGTTLDFKVFEVLRGERLPDSVTILGGDGASCRPYPEQLPVGTEWVLAVWPAPGSEGPTPQSSQFFLSNCGEHFLPLRGGEVRGHVYDKARIDWLSLQQLKQLIASDRPHN